MHDDDTLFLFGGDQPWDPAQWVTTDDRVRGGASTSALTLAGPHAARFHGRLDTSTLGGAGFASQHSAGTRHWDLAAYDGIVVDAPRADRRRYALTLKDAVPGRRPDGRERAGISWEADFVVADGGGEVFLPWESFKATYRGREKKDADPLDLGSVKRVGLMMRSFFGEQEGDFSIDLRAIAARRGGPGAPGLETAGWSGAQRPAKGAQSAVDEKAADREDDDDYDGDLGKHTLASQPRGSAPWWKRWLCGILR